MKNRAVALPGKKQRYGKCQKLQQPRKNIGGGKTVNAVLPERFVKNEKIQDDAEIGNGADNGGQEKPVL